MQQEVEVFVQISVPLPGVGVQTGAGSQQIAPVIQDVHSSVLQAAVPTHSEQNPQVPLAQLVNPAQQHILHSP